ncbi:MAG: streptothricin acetyltransferase [Chloroflexi bacterium]|jgi:ribosomal protein S18 acetylase RimI-like enzyme|nr:streptothricin acetyltransferase [Chloroflexota bacterium]
MTITIEEINPRNIQDADRCDAAFTVEAKLVLSAENDRIHYSTVRIPSYLKRYPLDSIDLSTYINNPDKAVFFAYVDGRIAGQIRLCRYWNRYAYIEDIVVDTKYRRQGVGRGLIRQGIRWAIEKQLPGVMLETQNNNIAACCLYASCGFELAGFDRCLYQGINPETDEIALYWYYKI